MMAERKMRSRMLRNWPYQLAKLQSLKQFLRYGAAGVAVSMGYSITVFVLVDLLHWMTPAIASATSFLLWTPVSYLVHRDFTFKSSYRSRVVAIAFAGTFMTRLVVSALVVYIFSSVLHLSYVYGVLANWIALPLLNYIVLSNWVFAKGDQSESEQTVTIG